MGVGVVWAWQLEQACVVVVVVEEEEEEGSLLTGG